MLNDAWAARGRLFRYLIAGAACAGVEYVLFVGLFARLGVNVHISNFLSLAGAAACNYLLSRSWVFGSGERRVSAEASLFAIVVAASFAANHCAFLLLYGWAGLDYRISKVAAMCLVTFLNYKAKRRLVFIGSKL